MDVDGVQYAGYEGAESTWTVDKLRASLVQKLEYSVPAHLVTLKLACAGEEEPTVTQEAAAVPLKPHWKLANLRTQLEPAGRSTRAANAQWATLWLLAEWPAHAALAASRPAAVNQGAAGSNARPCLPCTLLRLAALAMSVV